MFGQRLHTYTVHHHAEDGDTQLVREGFTIWGFVFGGLWLLYHRAWAMAGLFLGANIVLGVLEQEFGLAPELTAVVQMLFQLIIAFEGNDMRRDALSKRGYELADIVREVNAARAELRSYDRQGAA